MMNGAKNIDDEILRLARESNSMALQLLVKTYGQALFNQILQLIKRPHIADDILQETLIRAWRGLPEFRKESSLLTWLRRIAINEAYMYLRKEQRKQKMLKWLGKRIPKNEEQEMRQDPGYALLQGLALLPDKQRLVFLMRYYEDMDYSLISQFTGISEGSLKASYHHARKKMESWLEQFR